MPLIEQDTLSPVGVSPQADYKDPVEPSYSWLEIGAAASRDNSLVSIMLDARTRDQQLNLEAQPDYDVTAEDLAGYEDHADRLVWAKSPADLAIMKRRVDDEHQASEVLANSGWSGFAGSLAAGIIDPVNFIPVGGSLVKSAMLQRRVWESTKLAGRAGFVSSVASEAILQDTQMTRDLDQALTNIAAGTFLAGALGGGVGLIAGGERKALAEAFKDEVIEAHRLYHGSGGGQSVGAASATRRGTAEQESLKSSMGAAELGSGSESTIVGNPLSRLATSPSIETRRVGRELAEQTYIYKGEEDGIAGPQAVETRIKTWDGPLARAIRGSIRRLPSTGLSPEPRLRNFAPASRMFWDRPWASLPTSSSRSG